MMEVWNLWDVKPPPVCTVKTDLYFKEINELNEITYDALKSLRDLSYFDREAAILSRFLYKYKRIFRHDKGIQNLVKVNQCLKRYLKLNLLKVLVTFKQSIPYNFNPTLTHIYLPTRQMLKWVLLRLQAFSQIFARVLELTKAAGSYIYKKLCLGWSLYNSIFVFCITARILVTSKYLVAKSIEWYSSFYKYLPYLQETCDYLSDYNFPLDLKLWLGEIDLTPIKKKTFFDNIFEFIDLVKDDEEENENDIKQLVNEEFIQALFKVKIADINCDAEEIKEEKQPGQTMPYEDLGVPVDGNEEKVPKKKRRKRTFSDLVLIEDNKEPTKEGENRKRKFTDVVSNEDNKEEAPKKKRRRRKFRKKTFINLVSVEDNSEKAPKEMEKRKRTFASVVSNVDEKKNAQKEIRKRKRETFIDSTSNKDNRIIFRKEIKERKRTFIDLASDKDRRIIALKQKRKRKKTITDLVPNENNKEPAKEEEKKKRPVTDLVPIGFNREEVPKKKSRKRMRKRKKNKELNN